MCSDEVQNQDETGVDCGGSCKACPTCKDGIQNQDETGTDCGGSCAPCATCKDEIQNQDETGIDCGGSCDACAGKNIFLIRLVHLRFSMRPISDISFIIHFFKNKFCSDSRTMPKIYRRSLSERKRRNW